MSAFGLHPTFTDLTGYRAWRATWRKLHADCERRAAARPGDPELAVMLEKSRTLLVTARDRARRIQAMHRQIAEQAALFPLTIDAPSIDFHFNKIAIEFPFMPAWVIKAKGRSFYVNHVDFDCLGTTRETPEHPATKGSMRFRHATLTIQRDGIARITRRTGAVMAVAA